MPQIAPVPHQTLIRVFESDGFLFVRQRGDHLIYSKAGCKRPLVIPAYLDGYRHRRCWNFSLRERVQPDGAPGGIPGDAREVRLEHMAHRELPGHRQVDQLPVAIEEKVPRLRANFWTKEEPGNAEFLLRVLESLPHCSEGLSR